MPDAGSIEWIVVALCSAMVGISKCGVPGVGIIAIPLMAWVLPAKSSVGVLLGILILGDLFAAGYYRRNARWGHIVKLLPIAFVGIVVGYFALDTVDNNQLRRIIGAIVLSMLALRFFQVHSRRTSGPSRQFGEEGSIPQGLLFAIVMGFFAGIATMMANAAGPVMIIYLISMRLPKREFVGTAAWFFFVVNWVKVPFSTSLELMTPESLKFNLAMFPFIAFGAIIGIILLKRIPQNIFTTLVQILAAAAAIKLLL